jgi:acyl-CoA synthetase (AMP-forming)/AMP-acid ligase II
MNLIIVNSFLMNLVMQYQGFKYCNTLVSNLLLSVFGIFFIENSQMDRFIIQYLPVFTSTSMTEYEKFTIRDMICRGDQDPDHNAIESPGYMPLTYHELRMQIDYVVKELNAHGFHRNDRIAIVIPAGPEVAVSIISVMAGFTAVPLNPQNKEREYADIFSQLGIKAVIIQKERQTAATKTAKELNIPVIELAPDSNKAGKFRLIPSAILETKKAEFATPADIAYILLTSGTTAISKIVPVTQKQSAISRKRMCIASGITASDRYLHMIPYYHGSGLGNALLVPLIAGATIICLRDFIPSDIISILKEHRPTIYSAGPALHAGILREIKKRPKDELTPNSLHYIRTGTGALPSHVREELESLLDVPVIEAYGMSEAGSLAINIPPKKGSVGKPLVDSIQILDEDDLPLRPYSTGEIVLKGESVFNGYENAPGENKAAFIDGWFRTGDIGYLDDEGYLFLTGRKKEMINKGGEKISPSEIDAVLMAHPGVLDAMAFPIKDPVLGEDIAAMIVRKQENLSEDDLRRYLLDHINPSKLPRKIYFVDKIPKNPAGKPQRYLGTQKYS